MHDEWTILHKNCLDTKLDNHTHFLYCLVGWQSEWAQCTRLIYPSFPGSPSHALKKYRDTITVIRTVQSPVAITLVLCLEILRALSASVGARSMIQVLRQQHGCTSIVIITRIRFL